MKTTIGGDRLGSGNENKVSLKNYGRSTHDLGYIWRSSMSAGTLVPFMSEVALPGDSFDIDLQCDVKTLPTVGPLFGSYKVQLDVFEIPVRLYQGKLHMNMLNIGMDMKNILLPQLELHAHYKRENYDDDNAQINSSSIYSYLNMRGVGRKDVGDGLIKRRFNAVPYLGVWEIYKQYYANLQEEGEFDGEKKPRGYVIHAEDLNNSFKMNSAKFKVGFTTGATTEDNILNTAHSIQTIGAESISMTIEAEWDQSRPEFGKADPSSLKVDVTDQSGTTTHDLTDVFGKFTWETTENRGTSILICNVFLLERGNSQMYELNGVQGNTTTLDHVLNTEQGGNGEPQLTEFPLENIDNMKMEILQAVGQNTAVIIDENTPAPYGLGLGKDGLWEDAYCKATQEGLPIKTYQSDLFNNWISTEWIDGDNGVNEVSSVKITQNAEGHDVFTVDALNLANKVYNMLNRIAVSGGTYDDWLDAVYTHDRAKSIESPVYHGSLIKELTFEEVIAQADTQVNGETQPLGTLAGRGKLTGKHKGGKIKIKTNEIGFIIGIVSITPRIDYSQGNKWNTRLKSMEDFYKPELGQIGWQDLITDELNWADTTIDTSGRITYSSAGKQPAWIQYMTNVNQTRGNFAEQNKEMFMTLNRRYERDGRGIKDMTTYIDPSKYNYIFAQQEISSQNFWTQIGVKNTARRKMSAKVIPNL